MGHHDREIKNLHHDRADDECRHAGGETLLMAQIPRWNHDENCCRNNRVSAKKTSQKNTGCAACDYQQDQDPPPPAFASATATSRARNRRISTTELLKRYHFL